MLDYTGLVSELVGNVSLARQMGLRLFNRVYVRGKGRRLFGAETLLDLEDAGVRVVEQHEKGIRDVALKRIVGSENRSREYDRQFRPVVYFNRERWVNVATARMQGVPLPPIKLIQIGEDYYVRDGHHRLSVAAALGQEFIEAHVVVRKEG